MNDHAHDTSATPAHRKTKADKPRTKPNWQLSRKIKRRAADIAAQELAKRKAISAYEAAKHKAEQERNDSHAERERPAQ